MRKIIAGGLLLVAAVTMTGACGSAPKSRLTQTTGQDVLVAGGVLASIGALLVVNHYLCEDNPNQTLPNGDHCRNWGYGKEVTE